ncbi:ABC transporter ATP-binding protein [Brevibacillus invocatus]|uniref:ABC transporter ATP-binding protein n=1 Tax=Brevibacillus invocatus TaxID=173959 RepID=A0A3M8BYL2_9BACL|nr:ABC transporter ATP-binding protein [Brevibacillus invocatus]RNB68530.1 ABC transporter ATP-binding protein [Brevibacillus invocatus]
MQDMMLEVKGLTVQFRNEDKEYSVVKGISFHVKKGETLGLVGESGCGKSVTSLSIMRLIPTPPGKIVSGEIRYKGVDLLSLKEKEMNKIRGNEISMIFQEPMTSLTPVFTIGRQLDEVILLHTDLTKKQAKERSIEMLKLVGISRAEQIYASYPHELSGGMRQRVMIAIGLACHPQMLIADEPTTALDVTIQAQILDLMRELKEKTQTAILLVTHDLGVVAEMCDRVIVMYAGEIVEEADVDTLFHNPKHPYTRGLLESIPNLEEKKRRLFSIAGQVPTPDTVIPGCRFRDRCPDAIARCEQEHPELLELEQSHTCRCWLYAE